MIDRASELFGALRERRAVRFLVGYLVGGWVVAQIAGFFVEQGYVHRTVLDITLFLLVVCFFVVAVLVWFHGERGHQRIRRFEGVLLGLLLVAGGVGSAWIATGDGGSRGGTTGIVVDLGDNSVAVLPFQNQVGSPDLAWLDRGIPDLIATDLAQFDTLRVVSGQRLFDLLRQLGIEDSRVVPEQLQTQVTQSAGARYMLTGSVIGSGTDLQLVAQLSDVRTGEIRASARARGPDVFALVDRISSEISRDLLGRVIAEDAPVAQLTTTSLEAYRAYDQGRDARFQFLLTEAREQFERAIELDSTFALAHFQLAGLAFQQGDFANAVPSLLAAQRHLGTASERDRLMVGGFVDLAMGRGEEGEAKLRQLLTKYPDEKDARVILAGFMGATPGREAEIERLVRETVQLDPYYGDGWNQLAYEAAARGDYAAADTLVQRYVDLEPDQPNPYDSRGELLERQGRYEEARADYRRAITLREDFWVGLAHLARSYIRQGDVEGGLSEIRAWVGSESADARVWAWWLTADLRMWQGRIEGALATYDSTLDVARSADRPDLTGQVLDQIVRTNILLERYETAARRADTLRSSRGPDATTTAAALHEMGTQGRFGDMRAVGERLSRAIGGSSAFAQAAVVGTRLVIRYYEGDYAGAVQTASEIHELTSFPVVQFGYPGIRSAIEVGDAALARRWLEGIMASALQANFRAPPLESLYRDYFWGRIAELEGDRPAAARAYDELLSRWGDSLQAVPTFREVPSRRESLGVP